MKVQLERRLTSCPSEIECVVCRKRFEPQVLRSCLCNDQGLIQGDCCPKCLKLGSDYILEAMSDQTKKIREKLDSMFLESVAENKVKLPTILQRLSKSLQVFLEESYELQIAKMAIYNGFN